MVLTEVPPSGTFLVHGAVTRPDSDKLWKALRLAGGEWDGNRQFQLRVDAGPITPGWAIYAMKEFGKDLSRLSTSRTVTQKARTFYGTFRTQRLALLKEANSRN